MGAAVWSQNSSRVFRLPNHTTIYQAELFAIIKAIDAIINTPQDRCVIFTDSLSAIQAIQHGVTTTNELVGIIINKLFTCNKHITLVWVPGHFGIFGNEQADRLAKSASAIEEVVDLPWERGAVMSHVSSSLWQRWNDRWTNLQLHNKFKTSVIDWPTSYRSRREEVVLARLRLNATCLTHMTPYINRSFPPQCTTCNTTLTIEHILASCRNYAAHRGPLINIMRTKSLRLTAHNLLQDDEDIIARVMTFSRRTKVLQLL